MTTNKEKRTHSWSCEGKKPDPNVTVYVWQDVTGIETATVRDKCAHKII